LPPPTASLSLPSTPLCTNSALALSATTPDIYEGHLAYEWLVDGLPAGTERDLEFVFTETGMHDITLKTSIPGCMDEVTVTTPEIFAGPVVDFSYEGNCVGDLYSFQNSIAESVASYHWD